MSKLTPGSVTQVIDQLWQDEDGFFPIRKFSNIHLGGEFINGKSENIQKFLVGLAVDYMSRFLVSKDKFKSFQMSVEGIAMLQIHNIDLDYSIFFKWFDGIKDLDDESVNFALNLVRFDQFMRSPNFDETVIKHFNFEFHKYTPRIITNTKVLIKRTVNFINENCPNVEFGLDFEGAYTDTVIAGDIDFISDNTLWDLKTSSFKARFPNDTMQILMYYLMGLRSIHKQKYMNLTHIGFYNPRYDLITQIPVDKIPKKLIDFVNYEVIGYEK